MNTFLSRYGYSIQAKGWTHMLAIAAYFGMGLSAHIWAHGEPGFPVIVVLTVYAMLVEKFLDNQQEFCIALFVSALVDMVCVVNEAVRRDFAADLIALDHAHVSFPAEVFLTLCAILVWRKVRRIYF